MYKLQYGAHELITFSQYTTRPSIYLPKDEYWKQNGGQQKHQSLLFIQNSLYAFIKEVTLNITILMTLLLNNANKTPIDLWSSLCDHLRTYGYYLID